MLLLCRTHDVFPVKTTVCRFLLTGRSQSSHAVASSQSLLSHNTLHRVPFNTSLSHFSTLDCILLLSHCLNLLPSLLLLPVGFWTLKGNFTCFTHQRTETEELVLGRDTVELHYGKWWLHWTCQFFLSLCYYKSPSLMEVKHESAAAPLSVLSE